MDRVELLAVLDSIYSGGTADGAESQTLDFKTQKRRSVQDTLEDLADAVACFANAGGGTVVVGVADRIAGPDAFVGHSLDVDATRNRVYELTDPSVLVEVESFVHRGGDVLVMNVPRGVTVHKVTSKMPTERVGTSCMPMSTQRIASLVAERQGDDWSSHDSGVPVDEVDEVAVAIARSRLERSVDPRRREGKIRDCRAAPSTRRHHRAEQPDERWSVALPGYGPAARARGLHLSSYADRCARRERAAHGSARDRIAEGVRSD